MTSSGTNYDYLTMEELNQRIILGEISALGLPRDLLAAWAAWEPEPVPMSAYCLADPQQRQDFLHQYCYQGESTLFPAVSHIWDSLAEPRHARCTAMGIAAATGGQGKMALVLLLKQFLQEYLDAIGPLPRPHGYSDIDTWHRAAMASYDAEAQRLQALCLAYSAILDGAGVETRCPSLGKVISGPWL